MSVIKKVMLFIKNRFVKQSKVVKLEEPKIAEQENIKEKFIESLKIDVEKRTQKRVETLICSGDGLGIQKKITC